MFWSKKFTNTDEWIIEMANFIIQSLWDISQYRIRNPKNISAIFLAGAPGSGKSEFMETILSDLKKNFIVIDIDDYRNIFQWYDGENSSEYQQASVRVADKVVSYCFKNNLNFVLDGTFRSYGKVEQNLNQCKKKWRNVLINLIFQEPRISFYYTFLRKLWKKRNVPVNVFIDGFYDSIQNIFKALRMYDNVHLTIASKKYSDIDRHKYDYKIYTDITDIQNFCKTFRIAYAKWVFLNREKLKIDIENFQSTLIAHFCWKGWIFSAIRLWLFRHTFKW